MATSYNRNVAVAEAEAFDGTQLAADALVLAYPDIISVQVEETIATGDCILAVVAPQGILNAYKDTYIAFISEFGKADRTEVWTKVDFEANWTV